MNARDLLFAAALVAGGSYYGNHWIGLEGPLAIAWKGAGVGLLALWAAVCSRSPDGRLIAGALAFGALGDVLLDAMGFVVGGGAFLIGHLVAVLLYRRNPGSMAPPAPRLAIHAALAAAGIGLTLGDFGIGTYAFALFAMYFAAAASRIPLAAIGAALFVLSDLLIFARMGALAGSAAPGLLIWPTYFVGQALIAWGVVTTLRAENRDYDFHHRL